MATAEHILQGLKTVLKITKEAPVVVEAISGRLFFGSYNDYHSVLFECPTEWEDFKIVLSYNIAKELPRSVSGDRARFEIDGDSAKFISKGVRLKLALLDNSALSLSSLVKKYKKDTNWSLSGEDLKAAIARVSHSANDRSIGDIVLRGYHLSQKDDYAEVMASNGAALSVSPFPLSLVDVPLKEPVLLNPEFDQLSQLLLEKTTLGVSEDSISLKSESEGVMIRAVSTLTKGKPFDYQKVLEAVKQNELSVTFSVKSLAEAIKRTEFFTDESLKYKINLKIDIDGSDGIITASSKNHYGESSARIEVLSHTLEDSISVDISGISLGKYLSGTSSETATMYLKDEESPILIEDGFTREVIVLFRK